MVKTSRTTVVRRVRKLIAQAQGTSFQPEREAAFAKAQSLMTEHQISVEEAGISHELVIVEHALVHCGKVAKNFVTLVWDVAKINQCHCAYYNERYDYTVVLTGTAENVDCVWEMSVVLIAQGLAGLHADRPRSKASYVDAYAQRVALRLHTAQREAARAAGIKLPSNQRALHHFDTYFNGHRAEKEYDVRDFTSMASGKKAADRVDLRDVPLPKIKIVD